MNTDLTFITNEENQRLKDRFTVLIKDTSFFDCLVGYFYTSGFHAIYPSLENTEKIADVEDLHQMMIRLRSLEQVKRELSLGLGGRTIIR